MTPDLAVSILTFIAAVLGLTLSTQGIVPANLVPWVTLAIAVVNAALGIFFARQKPIAAARAMRAMTATKKLQ